MMRLLPVILVWSASVVGVFAESAFPASFAADLLALPVAQRAGVLQVAAARSGLYLDDGTPAEEVPQERLYREITYFGKGLYRVKRDNKYGLVHWRGKVLAQPQYNWIGYPYDEVLPALSSTRTLLLNLRGEEVKEIPVEAIGDFDDLGLAAVQQDGKMGLVDAQGRIVVPPTYVSIGWFANGLATIKIACTPAIQERYQLDPRKSQFVQGLINATGEIVIEPQYPILAGSMEGGYRAERGNLKFWYDKTGKPLTPGGVRVGNYRHMRCGMKAFQRPYQGKPEPWGFMNHNYEIVIEPQFEAVQDFHGETTMVYRANQSALIDKQGKVVRDWREDTHYYQPPKPQSRSGQQSNSAESARRLEQIRREFRQRLQQRRQGAQ